MTPASSAVKAPWGATSWVRPQLRRQYSERPSEIGEGGSCTTLEEAEAAEQQAWRRASGLANAGGGSEETGSIGGLPLPMGVNRASTITAVKVDNLAMVDSVSIEVRGALVYTAVVRPACTMLRTSWMQIRQYVAWTSEAVASSVCVFAVVVRPI